MITPKSPKLVLITGAEGALGHSVVEKFLTSGCRVIGTYLLNKPADRDNLTWIKMDLTQSKSVMDGLRYLRGDIDGLIHCAGGFRFAKVDLISDQDLDFLIQTNLKSAFLIARELVPGMKDRGYGRIVFVGARGALNPGAGMAAYAATKAGIHALTVALADEVKAFDINVNSVMPTIIDTPANRKDMPKADFATWVSPSELAEIIFSLTQPLGKAINGALIPVSGRI